MYLFGKNYFSTQKKLPKGSLASKTCKMTSELSITLYNSFQIRFDFPAAKMYSRCASLVSANSVILQIKIETYLPKCNFDEE